MAVVYECDAAGCEAKADSRCAVTEQGKKILLPPANWRLMDVAGRDVPAVLCPSCAAKVQEHQRAANDPAPRPKLGVIDGGLNKDET
jgi:hypothetical protein